MSDTAKKGSTAQVADESGGWLDKPLVVDEKSLPSKDDMARFNVPVDPSVTAERRAKAAAKEARTRAAYGGAPSLDDTTPPWVHQEEEAPEEWSPRSRPWWKAGLLAAAVILISAAFVLSMSRLPFGDNPDPEVAASADNSDLVEAINTDDSLRDGDMKFEGRVVPLQPGETVDVTKESGERVRLNPCGGILDRSKCDPKTAKFLIVELQVSNLGSSSLSFDPLVQFLVTNTGRRYGPSLEAQWFATLNAQTGIDGTRAVPVAPGQSVAARLTFDIPADEIPETLWLREKSGSAGTFTRL